MDKVFEIFAQLQATNSKKDKMAILTANSGNELFKKTLKWLLNPFVVTGIGNKALYKTIPTLDDLEIGLWEWEDVMDYLTINNTGKSENIRAVQNFILRQPTKYHVYYEQLVTKTLKLGVDAKTVNAVCGKGFVPVWDIQLGTPIDKCKIKEGTPFSLSRKLNGTRTIYYKGDFYTRSGRKYVGLDHIKKIIKNLNIPEEFVLDGELLYKNKEGLSDSEAFQIGTGIANSKTDSKLELKYCVFDIITNEDFERGISEKTYFERKKDLFMLGSLTSHYIFDDNLEVVPIVYEGTDQSEIQKWLDMCENELDWEGVIINLDTPYECKRTKNLIKVKAFYDVDLRCVRIEKGTGRNENTLGAIVCDFKGNEVNVGSGFTDEQRNYYYNNPDEIVDKIVTVKYKEVSKNKNGGESLQFPIFQCVRFDKDEESYN